MLSLGFVSGLEQDLRPLLMLEDDLDARLEHGQDQLLRTHHKQPVLLMSKIHQHLHFAEEDAGWIQSKVFLLLRVDHQLRNEVSVGLHSFGYQSAVVFSHFMFLDWRGDNALRYFLYLHFVFFHFSNFKL
jgi:hypothetical protein